ncbi:MAG: clostripain-related cysteine peptidase [Lachnospiraceae bacterium]|nr:clostripain-related cysteine peptidase [Lachnospiraceae bacterium]
MDRNRPRGREKNVTGGSGSVSRRGDGLHTGPVGSGGRPGSGSGGGTGGNRSGGGRSPMSLIILLLLLLFGGGGGLGAFLGGGGSGSIGTNTGSIGSGLPAGTSGALLQSLLGGGTGTAGSSGTVTGGWDRGSNTGKLNRNVVSGAREKRTEIKGDGSDQVTIMVYMCGTDLESRSGMATSDLQEMANASLSDNVNIIVYTGGCTGWKNNIVSSKKNQIYQVKKNGLVCLVDNAGNASMTKPDTLTGFIQWCNQNYPANRRELIFWDHGGGSISGYGYDEKNPGSGSMTLSDINQALKNAGVAFDFIGFDACLMATVETALMLDDYADYMIASEETEPGVGWYYTNWLTELSADPSMSTLEIGKRIADDFVDVCAQKCRGQKTTLSVVDLAETAYTIPSALADFSKDTTKLLENKEYKTVSDARVQAREFAQSSAIDQVDLVHLAEKMGTDAGDRLADALLSAVKYNRTASNMTNAYGLSIYFPYKKASNVDKAVNTYKQIGMDEEYARCIQNFASMEISGQAAAGGTSSVFPSLSGISGLSGNTGSISGVNSSDLLMQLLGNMALGQISNISGLNSSNVNFFSGKSLNDEEITEYILENQFHGDALVWTSDSEGTPVIVLPEEQWELVQNLELNVYFDDGEGYIDLGLDNVFDFNDEGSLIGTYDGTWLAINGQPVAYYYENTVDDGENYTITGHVPALLNGSRVNLILVFDNENPHGYIAGASSDYRNGETDTIAKNMQQLQPGDKLDFLCDYYTYEGEYQDSYYLGEQMTVTDSMEISNIDIEKENCSALYRFTDIYNNQYWTGEMQ